MSTYARRSLFSSLAAVALFLGGCSQSSVPGNAAAADDAASPGRVSSVASPASVAPVEADSPCRLLTDAEVRAVFPDAKPGVPADITGSNVNTSVTRLFATAGSYTFSCHIHPAMHGTVTVQ